MNSRFFFAPPKQRLAQGAGRWILPMRAPSGAKQCTPSVPSPAQHAPAHRLALRVGADAVRGGGLQVGEDAAIRDPVDVDVKNADVGSIT